VRGQLLLTDCLTGEVTRPAIEQALKDDTLLWLDLADTDKDTIDVLREVFKIHPLAIEDAEEFSQRPKVEDYDDFVYLVAYGARGLDQPFVEVHCFYAEHFFVSLHRDETPAIADATQALTRLHLARRIVALHRLLDSLTDSFFPFLSAFDDRIDTLQDQVFAKPTQDELAALFALKRQLVDMRKLVTPQRDMVSSMLSQVIPVPGITAESEPYIRDLYDHLIRISDMVDSYRDLLSGSLDAYMSVVSNRLNDVMKQLTIIATVFLPLSFLTGFFGQNFGWMVNRLGSLGAFLGLGLGTEVLAVLGLLLLFWRRGWM
jgi:magnesium transporter